MFARNLPLSTVGVSSADKSQLLKQEIMGPKGVWMSLPLEVPETVNGSLCSDSSSQNFPHPTPTSSFITSTGGQERSRKSDRTKIALRLETRSQGSFLLLTQLCSFTDRCSSFLTHKDVSGKGQAILLLPFLFLLEEQSWCYDVFEALCAGGHRWSLAFPFKLCQAGDSSATQSHTPIYLLHPVQNTQA